MPTATRIGCVRDEILVTFDGFGAAMSEKSAQSQGFGVFGPGRAGGAGGVCATGSGITLCGGLLWLLPNVGQAVGHP